MALTLTARYVKSLFPELDCDAVPDVVWAFLLQQTGLQVGVDPDKLDQESADGVAVWLLAHMASVWLRNKANGGAAGGASGPVSSVSAGQVSVTYRTPGSIDTASLSEAALMSTSYGQQYLALIRILGPRMVVSN